MPESFIKVVVFFSVVLLILNCQRNPGFPLTPEIQFKSISFIEGVRGTQDSISSIPISLYFTDGDGNLGLDSSDNTGNFAPTYNADSSVQTNPYFYNFHIVFLFKNSDNSYKECKDTPGCAAVIDSAVNLYNGRFPRLNKSGKDQPISGILTYSIKSAILKEVLYNKTLKFQIYILDRDLNQSNTIITDTLTIK